MNGNKKNSTNARLAFVFGHLVEMDPEVGIVRKNCPHCRAQYSPHHIRATFFSSLSLIQLLFNCLASALTLSCDKFSLTNFQGLRTIYLQRRKKKHQNIIITTPASSDPLFRLLGSTGPELNQSIALHCAARIRNAQQPQPWRWS